jgi:hypothetical protein
MELVTGGRYGIKTGICEACGAKMKGHPKCEACGILTGFGHETESKDYREHHLCEGCIKAWLKMERRKKKEVEWWQFYTLGWGKEMLNR